MRFKDTRVLRFAVILSTIHRVAIPWLVIGLCILVVYKYGVLALVLGCGFVAAAIGLPNAFYKGILVPLLRGVQCPGCHEWGLVRVACISFGYRFFRCDYCGQRCKRLDYESPWVDSSGKEDDDMYKPIPLFGPRRREQATRCVLLAIGSLAILLLFPLLGSLIGGERGGYVGSAIGVWISVLVVTHQREEKKIMHVAPVLWDREVDCAHS
jgi:hypothetical protein